MKKNIITLLIIALMISNVYAANVQRGVTYSADGEVTNTNLHQLVDDATVTDIAQADVASNNGLTIRSGSSPSDTDALWYDTGTTSLKAYNGSSWVKVSLDDPTFATLTVTGDAIFSSNITVDTVNSVDYDETRIKGWVNFTSSGDAVIVDSFNVSSVTYNGTGDYTVNWDTDFSNNDYAVAVLTGGVTGFGVFDSAGALAVGSARIQIVDSGGSGADGPLTTVIAIGDQ